MKSCSWPARLSRTSYSYACRSMSNLSRSFTKHASGVAWSSYS